MRLEYILQWNEYRTNASVPVLFASRRDGMGNWSAGSFKIPSHILAASLIAYLLADRGVSSLSRCLYPVHKSDKMSKV